MATVRSHSGVPFKQRKYGESVVTWRSNFGPAMKAMSGAKQERAEMAAAKAGAKVAKRALRELFLSSAYGAWAENRPYTKAWKGHETIMKGMTGALGRGVKLRPMPEFSSYQVGWFDDPHPGTGGRLTMGQLAHLHEFGNPANTLFGNPAPIPSRPMVGYIFGNAEVSAQIVTAMAFEYLSRIKGLAGGSFEVEGMDD